VELVDRFQDRLFNFLLRRAGQAADAEDLTQEALVRAWRQIGKYRAEWRFSTWLFTIGARLTASHHRSRRRAAGMADLSGTEEMRAGDGDDGGEDRDRGRRLWAAARLVLEGDSFDAVWLRYAEGMNTREVAAVLGRTEVGVRVLLFRARAALAGHVGAEEIAERPEPVVEAPRVKTKKASPVAGGVRC
jgi:RNA polymerase sigma-70 factor (ECF subfamily)